MINPIPFRQRLVGPDSLMDVVWQAWLRAFVAAYTTLSDAFDVLSLAFTATGTRRDIAFSAANFGGNNLMTWVLTSPDQTTYSVQRNGDQVIVALSVFTTTVGGTPDTELRLTLPDGWTFSRTVYGSGWASDNSGTLQAIIVRCVVGEAFFRLVLDTQVAWQASANNTFVGFIIPVWVTEP